MITAPLGSTELTNQLLTQASQTTGIAAPTFPTINSTSTTPATPITPVTPTQTSVPDISNLDTKYTPLTATPQETQESSLSSRIQSLNDSLSGKSAYQTQQNTAAGVDQITQAINDNNTAVKQLQNDTSIAKLNQENRQAPTFAISGEQGAIDRSSAVKALTLSSISDVLQNNLVAAQHKADAAVAAQYGPQEAELAAKTANLKLIQNDPSTTLADKNRAAAQQLVLNKQAADIAQAKDDRASVLKIVADAGQNNTTFTPSAKYPTLAMALSAIASAKDPITALQIQAAAGLNAKAKLDTSITEIGGRRVLVNNQTGATIKDLGAATGGGLTPKDQANDVASAVLDFQKQMQQKGWAGANPEAYNYYRASLASTYGASAALALDKAMSDANITVDYTNK